MGKGAEPHTISLLPLQGPLAPPQLALFSQGSQLFLKPFGGLVWANNLKVRTAQQPKTHRK